MSHLQPVPLTFENEKTRYPKEYRDWCFQLWATDCVRNMERVLDRLRQPLEFDPPLLVSYPAPSKSALVLWKKNESWDDRWVYEFRKIHRNKFDLTTTKIASYAEEMPDILYNLATSELSMMEVPARDRITAAKTLLDMAGHLSYQLKKDDQVAAPPRWSENSVASLGTDEIARRIAARSQEMIDRSGEFVAIEANHIDDDIDEEAIEVAG